MFAISDVRGVTMKIAAIYCRVSSDLQEREGTSLETQLEACLKYCQERGYEVTYQFSEVYSGLTLERPKLNELRELVRAGEIQVIVVYCLDRLSRDPVHGVILIEELEKHGVSLEAVTESVDTTDLGKLISYIRGYAAKVEALKIVERTSRGRKKRAEMGKIPAGGRLYGYSYNRGKEQGQGVRIENPDESKWVKEIFRWYIAENIGIDRIVYRLRGLGIPAPSGKGLWYGATVYRILTNPAYTGETYAFRETHKEPAYRLRPDTKGKTSRTRRPREDWIALPQATPSIIDNQTFEAVQERLKRNKELAKRNSKVDYLLKGLIRCGRCGRLYWGYVRHYHPKSREWCGRYYGCSGNVKMVSPIRCGNKNLNADRLEAQVWAEVEKVITKPNIVLQELEQRGGQIGGKNILKEKLEQVEAQLLSLKRRHDQDTRLFEWGGIEDDVMKQKIERWRSEKQRLTEEKNRIQAELDKVEELEIRWESIERFCQLLRQRIPAFTTEGKRLALEALGVEVLVDGSTVSVSGDFLDKRRIVSTPS